MLFEHGRLDVALGQLLAAVELMGQPAEAIQLRLRAWQASWVPLAVSAAHDLDHERTHVLSVHRESYSAAPPETAFHKKLACGCARVRTRRLFRPCCPAHLLTCSPARSGAPTRTCDRSGRWNFPMFPGSSQICVLTCDWTFGSKFAQNSLYISGSRSTTAHTCICTSKFQSSKVSSTDCVLAGQAADQLWNIGARILPPTFQCSSRSSWIRPDSGNVDRDQASESVTVGLLRWIPAGNCGAERLAPGAVLHALGICAPRLVVPE